MEPTDINTALESAQREITWGGERLEIERVGNYVNLLTGQKTVRHSRNYARMVGALVAAAGAGLLYWSIWGAAAIALGILVVAVAPRFIRSARLLEIDLDHGQLRVTQSIVGAGATVPTEGIRSIRGAYETKGWDGYTVIYTVAADGSETPVMMLFGTDETLAEHTCRVLGVLLDRPASYAGPFGSVSTCFTPVQPT